MSPANFTVLEWIKEYGLRPNISMLEPLLAQSVIIRKDKKVVKNYSHVTGLFKWSILANIYRLGYPFAMSPSARMRRELRFFFCMKSMGTSIGIPLIYSFDIEKNILVREYIEGRLIKPEDSNNDSYILGKILGELHSLGWTLGDTKSDNFIIGEDNRYYVIDAEQAERLAFDPRMRAWDILTALLIVSLKKPYMTQRELSRKVDSFMKGYNEGGNPAMTAETLRNIGFPTLAALLPLFPWHHVKVIKEKLILGVDIV